MFWRTLRCMVFDWLTLESSQRQKPKLIMHCFLPSLLWLVDLPGGALLLSVHMSLLPFFLYPSLLPGCFGFIYCIWYILFSCPLTHMYSDSGLYAMVYMLNAKAYLYMLMLRCTVHANGNVTVNQPPTLDSSLKNWSWEWSLIGLLSLLSPTFSLLLWTCVDMHAVN